MTSFTSTSYTGFNMKLTRNEILVITDVLTRNTINLRATELKPICSCKWDVVFVPGVVGESNTNIYKEMKDILNQLHICWEKIYWVVVDNQPIPGQFNAIWMKLGRLVNGLQFGIDETGMAGIVTCSPRKVMRKLISM